MTRHGEAGPFGVSGAVNKAVKEANERQEVAGIEMRMIAVLKDKVVTLMPPETKGWGAIDWTGQDESGNEYSFRIESPHETLPGSRVAITSSFRDYLNSINNKRTEPISYLESTARL